MSWNYAPTAVIPTSAEATGTPEATSSLQHQQITSTTSTRAPRVMRTPDHYEMVDQIGKGAYGTVYKARDRLTGNIVALKTMRFALTEDGVPMAILREISLLKQLERFDHPNIVRLLDITHGQRRDREMSLHLIFEHIHQDLDSYLRRCPPPGLGLQRIKDLMFQILCGVDFLHSHRIVHRDLKPQNLLVTLDGVVKLTDFGLARIYDFYTLLTSVVVTLWYRSPEVLMGLSYATPVDLWACGCIFAELHTRTALFDGKYEKDQLCRIFEVLGTPSDEEWPENAAVLKTNFADFPAKAWNQVVPELEPQAEDLLEKMLKFEPSKRISASEALKHPFFAEYGQNGGNQTSSESGSSPIRSSPILNLGSNSIQNGGNSSTTPTTAMT